MRRVLELRDMMIDTYFNHFEKKILIAKGVREENIQVIGCAVEPDEFKTAVTTDIRTKYGLGESPFFFFLGRFAKGKGIDNCLKAMREVWKKHKDVSYIAIDINCSL